MTLEEYKLTYLYKSSNVNFVMPTTPFFNLSSEPNLSNLNSSFNLGLKHIPIPQDNQNKDIRSSLNRTINSIGWQVHYARLQKDSNSSEEPWNPAFGRFLKKKDLYPHPLLADDPATLTLNRIKTTVNEYLDAYPSQRKQNTELHVLRQLKKRYPLIIFTASDKNLGLVALDLPIYNQMVLLHLNDTKTYRSLGPNSLINFMESENYNYIKFAYQQLQQYLLPLSKTDQERRLISLQPSDTLTVPKFHVLPKLHKAYTFPDIPSRPIAGATNWITTSMSVLLDSKLQSLLDDHPLILKNSQSLLQKFHDVPVNPNSILVTLDVTALYPNINIDRLCDNVLAGHPTLQRIARFVLKNNYVQYGNEVFEQIDGIAMGTNCAVNLANLYCAHFLDPHLSNHTLVSLFGRFIDDIFLLWNGTEAELLTFINDAQSICPGIQFTFKYSSSSIDFLDLKIENSPLGLNWSTHQKELNKYLYLTPKTCHPRHVLSGFIRGELIRYKRTSSTPQFYNTMRKLLFIRLLRRGFSYKYLTKVCNVKWTEPVNTLPRIAGPVLPLTLTYTCRQGLTKLPTLLRPFKHAFDEWLPNSNFMPVFSASRNVASIVTSSALSKTQRDKLTN
jgi:hypothetical protein